MCRWCCAYERWRDLERRCGRALLTECGCLSIVRPDGELIAGVRESAGLHRLEIEDLDAAALRRRFPAFQFDDQHVGVLEPSAGFLYVDDCVQAHVAEARALGATIRDNEAVVSWKTEGAGVAVETAAGRYTAGRLVITAGPWAGRALADLGLPLTVMRQVVFWIGARRHWLSARSLSHVHRGDAGGRLLRPAGAELRRPQGRPALRGAGAARPVRGGAGGDGRRRNAGAPVPPRPSAHGGRPPTPGVGVPLYLDAGSPLPDRRPSATFACGVRGRLFGARLQVRLGGGRNPGRPRRRRPHRPPD